MRRRYIASTLAIVLGTVVAMAAVLMWVIGSEINIRARQQLDAEAERVGTTLHQAADRDRGLTVADLSRIAPTDRTVVLTLDGGEILRTGVVGSGARTFEEEIPGVGTLLIADTGGTVRTSQIVSASSIVLTAIAISILAVAVTIRAARRLTDPLGELAMAAERLGAGDLRPSGGRFNVPELDRVADAMDSAAAQIASLLADERSLTVDASHQLRTPLTALSIRLEEIETSATEASVRREAGAALEQVERLSGVVDDLLVNRRGSPRSRALVDLSKVVGQQAEEWAPAFSAVGRELELRVAAEIDHPVPAGPVGQVLAALLENALQHGDGLTRLSLRAVPGGVVVEVTDRGLTIPHELADRIFERAVSGSGGTGVGLAAARDAAVSV
ncbi:MAG TPA: HAMP domain-containing sensor histidine kinase, partial [Actinomycetes bacterium]|nr:HAMP domain-containing sensor histidine kinase [Actinomycetes bacterium]